MFSAIVTAFLIPALDDLEPNYQKQSALLLHQLLNGRDPNLANISDPTIPFKPTSSAIAVNCLWFASLSASLCASFCAMIFKEWFAEYDSGLDPVVDLLRACQRQIRFMVFQRWNIRALVALFPPLLYSSVILFFVGAIVRLWQVDKTVAIVYQVMGGIFGIIYLSSTVLPLVMNTPLRPYSTLLLHRLSVAIGKVFISIVDVFAHVCFLTLRFATGEILPREYKHMDVWWANALGDSLDKVDTSQRVQEEAILWLSQMPLNPSESRVVVSSLALISSSHPHSFPKSVMVLLNLILESSLCEGAGQEQVDVAIDCVLVLGQIKFQSVVDQNSDRDHEVGGIHLTDSVAWAAQQLTVNAFQERFSTSRSEGIRVRLLTAAAWLSPADSTENVYLGGGERLKIQGRDQFIQELKIMLQRHISGEKVLGNKVLINLIHGMHASIPRGDYGLASSTIPFPPALCGDYDSPWSEDESVLKTLITYALDLLSPPDRGRPLVERTIKFDELASELIDALMVNNPSPDVVAFGFWLIYRVTYAFKLRKTTLADISQIWTSAVEPIKDDTLRQRLNSHTVDAFVAVAQCHVSSSGALPQYMHQAALRFLSVALESEYSRPMATYAIAMILNLGKSAQVAVTSEIKMEPFIEALFSADDDLESGTTTEDAIDLHIYSTLILLKLRPTVELDVGEVRGLIERMEKTIGTPSVRDSGVIGRSEADISADPDRVRWKAIYLSALLFLFVPDNSGREEHAEGLRERVRALARSGGLPVVADYDHCLEPLMMYELEPGAPTGEQPGQIFTAFEGWIGEFPLFPLPGSVASART